MTQEQEQALRHFETRVRQLILHCGELARENERLAAEVEKRNGIIAQKDKDFAELRRDSLSACNALAVLQKRDIGQRRRAVYKRLIAHSEHLYRYAVAICCGSSRLGFHI